MNTTARRAQYSSSLRRLMEHKTKEAYAKTREFTEEEVLDLTPADIVGWFNTLAYGTPTPEPDARPTGCRSTTLLNHKKRISYFHPRKDQQWDSIRAEGNPTRSQAVNALIGTIRVHEVRHTGVKSQARRAFTLNKFHRLLAIALGICTNTARCAAFISLVTLQWSIIGRVDDMQKIQVRSLLLFDSFFS